MAAPDLTQNLEYGFIYVIGNPKQTHNLRWFATMIEPMIRPLSLQWVETWDVDHTLIVARRFNVGNLGKYATVQLHLNRYGRSDSYSLLAAVHAFSDCLQDVMDSDEGDVVINEHDYHDHRTMPQGKWGQSTSSEPLSGVLLDLGMEKMPQDHTRVSSQHPTALPIGCPSREDDEERPKLGKRLKKLGKSLRKKVDDALGETVLNESADYMPLPGSDEGWEDEALLTHDDEADLEEIEAEEVLEFKRIETEYERDVKDLRARIVAFISKYHQDPHQVMTTMLEGKVLLGTTPSRLLVNGDMKIVLPEYDEMEIEMPAMCRTLYILFMKHRKLGSEGIVLKYIDTYRDELIDLYSLVKPGASDERVKRTVDNMCSPYSESLHQTISRINRCIRNVITDKQLAQDYCIMGERGQQYSIELAPDLIELPRAVSGQEA